MRRRSLLLALGGVFATPRPGHTQRPIPRIGVLVLGNADPEEFMAPFRQGLRETGYVEGQSVLVELRSAGGKSELLPELAAALIRQKVDVIVTWQTPPAIAAKRATASIPIVICAGDPIANGLVASLSRPGGSITGLSTTSTDLTVKRIGLLREVLPSLRRLGVLLNKSDPITAVFIPQFEQAGRMLGVEIEQFLVRPEERFDPAFAAMQTTQVQAVYVQGSLLRKEVPELAMHHRLPSVSDYRLLPRAGGLMSYAPDHKALFREAAVYVDKILKGAKPADLPVQEPTRFELVINAKTAAALGLTIPPAIFARADEVIE